MKYRLAGFSLIEIMIVMVIVGILGAVAYPNYIDSVRKGRRAEATSALLKLAVAQERMRANTLTYVTDMKVLDNTFANSGANTLPSGLYSVIIDSATNSAFKITASEVAGKDQAADTCGDFVITQNGPDFSGGNANRACWSQ